jgi:peptidoglycan hydrolase CwlO-like protein
MAEIKMAEVFRFNEYLRKNGKAVTIEDKNNKNSGGNSGGGNMEARIAKLESSVEHIQADIADIKTDIREFKAEVKTEFGEIRTTQKADFQYLNGRIDRLSDKIDTHIYWFVGIIVTIIIATGLIKFF